MSRIAQKTMHRIAEDALGILLEQNPKPLTTREIARELARDKEFVKKVMEYLSAHGMVKLAGKKTKGEAQKWRYWQLTERAEKVL